MPIPSAARYPQTSQIRELIAAATTIVIMQADNPDADSLASALALEHILGDMGKQPLLYCGVHVPDYLRYLPGWDRVSDELPGRFDLTIIVDTSAGSLFGSLRTSGQEPAVTARPCIVIDHHTAGEASIPYASVVCNQPAVATGEVLYELAGQLDWPLNAEACHLLTASIMSDSLGLTSEGTSARSIAVVSELVTRGVSIAKLEYQRRELMRKSADLLAYKGRLLQRVEYHDGGRLATITIPWEEIQQYSHAYNPSMLVMDDMRYVEGVDVAIAFKLYADGHMTAKIRCNYGRGIAADLAQHFGGGGHPYASGFKIEDILPPALQPGRSFETIKQECLAHAGQLLDELYSASDASIV